LPRVILAGDAFQIVLAQRFRVSFTAARRSICYRALRSVNPSPYMYYLDLGSVRSSAPRRRSWVTVEQKTVRVRPIAGTRPRGKTPEEDVEWRKKLLAD